MIEKIKTNSTYYHYRLTINSSDGDENNYYTSPSKYILSVQNQLIKFAHIKNVRKEQQRIYITLNKKCKIINKSLVFKQNEICLELYHDDGDNYGPIEYRDWFIKGMCELRCHKSKKFKEQNNILWTLDSAIL